MAKKSQNLIKINAENIKSKVHILQEVQVMLDSDLAEIYGYDIKAMNQ